jgi:predicted transposase/invertase (TIGR01784 family)
MYYIKYRGKEDAMEGPIMKAILEDTSEIREAEKRLPGSFLASSAAVRPSNQEFTADAELRDRLEARDKFRRTHLQLLHDAEQKGKAEGLEEGRIENSRETARKLKARDMPIAEIAAVTDLLEDEIREL